MQPSSELGALEETIAKAVSTCVRELRSHANDQSIAGHEQTELVVSAALALVRQVRISPGILDIQLCPDGIKDLTETEIENGHDELMITLPFTERRRGVEMKIVAENGSSQIDMALLNNVALANHWYQQLKDGRSFDDIASDAGTSKRRVQQIVELAFLAPDIVRDITKGTQPMGLTSDWCLRHDLPGNWQAQRERIIKL